MRNFQRLSYGNNFEPLLNAVLRQPELWNYAKVRTWHEQSAHRVVDDIVLRYNMFAAGEDFVEKVCSETFVVDYPAMDLLVQARPIIFSLMTMVEGEHLGRVFVSRMAPGIMIPPHSDRIPPAEEQFPGKIPPAIYYERYHAVLKSQPGVQFTCGDETVYMAPGELWWFNNLEAHSVMNNSADDRVHLVIDIATKRSGYVPGC